MMNFELSTEQKEIRELAMKFAKNEMMPKAGEYDIKAEMPMDILTKAWELGLVNTCIPAEYGGAGFTALDSMIITEALAYGCLGMNTAIMANDLALLPILIGGTDEQKKRFFTPFTESYKLAAFCLTEPGSGSDAYSIKTKAVDNGDGTYTLNGQKLWITNGGSAEFYTVFAKTDHEIDGVVKRVDDDSIGIVFNGGRESELKLKDFLSVENVAQCLRSIHDYKDQVEIPTNLVCWLRADGPFEVFVWTHPDGEISRMQVIMMNHFVEWNDGKGLKSGEITSIKNHDSPLVTEEEFEFLIDPKLDELKLQFASRIVNGVDAEGLDPEVYDFLCRKLGNAS